jgi:SOS-response transcriptional repressor LexA
MHPIQQQLIELAQRYDLGKMGLRQIGKLIGVDHPQKVKFHLQKLGLLDGNRKKRPTFSKPTISKTKSIISVPILGLANCGDATMFAEARIEGALPISKKLLPTDHFESLFAVRAVGNSMNRADIGGKNIEDGDFVIVDGEDRNVRSGDYVLSVIGGMANIKRFVEDKEQRQIVLQPQSDQFFPSIHIHEDDINDYLLNGKVIEVMKQPREEVLRYERI